MLQNKKLNFPFTLSITSGKGGVGKTVTSINLAHSFQRMGYRVLLLDGDFGLANIDILLNMRAQKNIFDVIEGHCEIADIILEGPSNIHVIPSGSGIYKIAELPAYQRYELFHQLQSISKHYDIFMIDTGAGIAPSVIHLNNATQCNLIVTTPEPHAITDAYAMIKVITESNYDANLFLLPNLVHSEAEGVKIHQRISEVVDKYLHKKIKYIGCIPLDPQLQSNIMKKTVVSEKSQHTISGQAAVKLAALLIEIHKETTLCEFDFAEQLLLQKERNNILSSKFISKAGAF